MGTGSDGAKTDPGAAAAPLPVPPLVIVARALRDFGDGFAAVILPAYLLALGFHAVQVGVIATAALLGSAALTLGVGFIGDRYDHRRLLMIAAAMMTATGLVFASVSNYAVLLIVAFGGTMNPGGGSTSVFVPIEHALLTRAVAAERRTRMFSHYGLVGSLAGALGALAASTPDLAVRSGLDQLTAMKLMFVLYGVLGLLGGLVYSRIPPQPVARAAAGSGSALGPSRGIVYKLAALFSLDSFGSGFVVQSLLALWLFERFGMSLAAASVFFFWSGVAAAFSYPVAAWLAGRIGLVNTMVFTHIPANLALILAAFAPDLSLALVLLLIRAALSQMDVPARSSYVMAVVTEAERTAAASFTAVPRSLATAASPALSGLMFGWWLAMPLIASGTLKIVYDLLLLYQFRHIKPPEER